MNARHGQTPRQSSSRRDARNLVVMLAMSMLALSAFASADTLLLDIAHDGHTEKAVVSQDAHAGTVTIFEDGKLMGNSTI